MKFSLNLLLFSQSSSYPTPPRLAPPVSTNKRVLWRRSRLSSTNTRSLAQVYNIKAPLLIRPSTSLTPIKHLISFHNKGNSLVSTSTWSTILITNKVLNDYFVLVSSVLQVYSFLPTLLTLTHFTSFLNLKVVGLTQHQLLPSKFQHLGASKLTSLGSSTLHLL